MTYREKLKQEFPQYVGDQYAAGCRLCPDDYGYVKDRMTLPCTNDRLLSDTDNDCVACWNMEIEDD